MTHFRLRYLFLPIVTFILVACGPNRHAESFINDAQNWYERHGNANQKMLAYYILGCAYRDLEDALSALKYLNQAVDSHLTLLVEVCIAPGRLPL